MAVVRPTSVWRIAGLSILSALPLTACGEKEPPWPTQAWEVASPESAGLDSSKLADALMAIRSKVPNTHGIFLVRHGRVVVDADFYPYDGKVPHNVASVTKSVMTTLVAIAADQGKLELDQPMLSFFPDRVIANRDPLKERITVRHLTGMVSGLDCVGEHDEPTLHEMEASPDWIQFALDRKMVAEPGTVFSYCSPGMHLLSAIVQQATGTTALDFARKNLFEPLGIREVIWPADPQGFNRGWGDLHLYARDAAKIGYLWLHGGKWDGKQIVSRDWVEQSSKLQIKTGPYWGDDYGYGWWIMTGEEIPQYAASGRGGQRIAVFPTLDTVAVTVAGGIDPGDALGLIGGALVSPEKALPSNSGGEDRLKLALDAIRKPPSPTAVVPLPSVATAVSGKVYRFAPNPLQMVTMRLDFDTSAEAHMAITFAAGQPPRVGALGLDGVYRMSPGENGLPVGARGRWADETTFVIEYDGIASIDAFDLRMHFDDDRVAIDAKDRTYEAGVTAFGTVDPTGG
jgi:CubicO group peptidase (beta-lactamase class C family)